MSEFHAEAIITVRANTAPFVAQFTKAAKQVEKTQVAVTVRASMTGFRQDLIAKLATSTKGVSVKIPVRADMTGFRADLQAKLAASTRGLTATVGIKAGAVSQGAVTAAAAGAAAGGGSARVARTAITAEQALTDAVNAGIFARRQVLGALDRQEKRVVRLAREQVALKAAEDAGRRAVLEQNAVLQTQAAVLERDARAAAELTRAQIAREKTRLTAKAEKPERLAAEAKAAEQAAKAELVAREAVVQKSRQVERDLSEAKIAAKQAEVEKILAIDKKALDKQATQRRIAQRQISRLTEGVAGITPESLAGLGARAGGEGEIRKQITKLTATEKEAKKLLLNQNLALNEVEKQTVEALAQSTGALKVNATAALANATAQTKLAHTFANVRRAAIAQAAAITGLRGAALTAATAFIATAAAIISLKKAVDLAAKMESLLSVFAVTAGATAEQMELVHEKAIELGKDITLPGVSASDAAVALTELSKAGLSVQDSLDGAKGVLQLATAANIDFQQATLLTANALNAFGLAGSEASHVADVFANSANASQGSIVDASVAMQQASAVLRQAGISFEEGQAALTLFARAGLRGSDAGTSLRTALIRLINPSEKAADQIAKLGLNIRDSQGNIDLGVFQQFADATRGMSAAARDQALAIIFGQDAIRGAAILVREGNLGLAEQTKNLNKVGTAAEVASARTSGYAGAVENLNNQIEAVAEAIGAAFLPPLTEVVNLLSNTISTVDATVHALDGLRSTLEKPFKFFFETIGLKEAPEDLLPEERETDREFAGRAARALVSGNIVDIGKLAAESWREAQKEIQDYREDLEDLSGLDISSTPTINQAQEQVRAAVDEIERANERIRGAGQVFRRGGQISLGPDVLLKGDPTAVHETVLQLKELQEELQAGDEEAKQFAQTLGEFILELQEASAAAVFPKIKAPPDLLNDVEEQFRLFTDKEREFLRTHLGKGFHLAGLEGNTLFLNAFVSGLEPNLTLAGARAKDAFLTGFDPASVGDVAQGGFFESFTSILNVDLAKDAKEKADAWGVAAKKWWKDMQRKVAPAVRTAKNQVLGTERAQVVSQIGDDPTGEIEALRDREQVLRRAIARIDKAQQQGEPIAGALEARTKFRERLEATIEERKGIEKGIKDEAEKKKQDVKKKQDEADQAVLDALFPATRKLETRALIAQGTEQVQDDIRIAKAQIANNKHRIAVISKSFNDRQAAEKLIADIRDENIQLSQQIAEDTKADAERLQQKQQEAFEAQVSLAQAEGNVPKQIALINRRIAAINAQIAAGKAEGAALNNLKTERAQLQNDREALQDQEIANRIALGQSILDLTGNKNPLLRAINAAIAETRKDIAAAKKAGKSTVVLRTALNNFIKQRKDVLKEAKKEAKEGTSAFDLLAQFNARFSEIAGTAITPDQPFAGGSAFTTDIVNKAISNFMIPHRPIDLRMRGETDKQSSVINANTEAVRKNTEALLAGGGRRLPISNDTTAGSGEKTWVPHGGWWTAARQAREARDG